MVANADTKGTMKSSIMYCKLMQLDYFHFAYYGVGVPWRIDYRFTIERWGGYCSEITFNPWATKFGQAWQSTTAGENHWEMVLIQLLWARQRIYWGEVCTPVRLKPICLSTNARCRCSMCQQDLKTSQQDGLLRIGEPQQIRGDGWSLWFACFITMVLGSWFLGHGYLFVAGSRQSLALPHAKAPLSESGQVVWCFVRASLTSH